MKDLVISNLFASGEVYRSFSKILLAHGVSRWVVDSIEKNSWRALLGPNPLLFSVQSTNEGRIKKIDQRSLGHFANFDLGCGGNDISGDFRAKSGIILNKRLGDMVRIGEGLCLLVGLGSENAISSAKTINDLYEYC